MRRYSSSLGTSGEADAGQGPEAEAKGKHHSNDHDNPPHFGQARVNACARPSGNISVDEASDELAVSATTARLEGIEKLPCVLELANALADFVSLRTKPGPNGATRKAPVQDFGESSKLANSESQRTENPHDSHAANRLRRVEPIPGRRTIGLGHQSNALVIAQRVDADPGPSRDIADAKHGFLHEPSAKDGRFRAHSKVKTKVAIAWDRAENARRQHGTL